MKINISTDSTADLPLEMYKNLGVTTIHMGISNVHEKGDFFSDKEVTPEMIYKAIEELGLTPKTSAGLESDYREQFEKATKDGDFAIHFSIGNLLSASHANAKRAAQGLERVFIIDSKTLSAGTGFLIIKACELRDQGLSAEEIYNTINDMVSRLDVSFIINDLKYLHRGGRVTGLKLLGANLLKIRPSLQIDQEGRLVPGKKYKGQFKNAVMEYVTDKIKAHKNSDKSMMIIATSSINDETIKQMAIDEFEKQGFNVQYMVAGTTITIHSGRNTIGMAILKN